jgi:hypothetical protein
VNDYQSADGPQGKVLYKRGPESGSYAKAQTSKKPYARKPQTGSGAGKPNFKGEQSQRSSSSSRSPKPSYSERSSSYSKAPSGSYSRGPKSADARSLAKPFRSALKASQIAALKAAVDREIPQALKRLSEAQDRCRLSAEEVLTATEQLSELLSPPSDQSSPEENLETARQQAKALVSKLNTSASFNDLVGQRLMKVSEFLETLSPIFSEIVDEASPPPRKRTTDRQPAGDRDYKKPRGSFSPKFGARSNNSKDKAPRGVGARGVKTPYKGKRDDKNFGPDDDGKTQKEVDELVKKIKK